MSTVPLPPKRPAFSVSEPLTLEGRTYHPRASIGLAAADGVHTSLELLERADLAMYEAKRAGKGRCRVWGAGA